MKPVNISPLKLTKSGRPKVYWTEKNEEGKKIQHSLQWTDLPKKELQILVKLSKMPDCPERWKKIKSTPWLKKGGCDYDTDGFRMRVLERVRSLREKLQMEAKAHIARFSNPPARKRVHHASGNTPLLSFLNACAKQCEMLQRLKEELPTQKWDKETWRMVASCTKDIAQLHATAKMNLGQIPRQI